MGTSSSEVEKQTLNKPKEKIRNPYSCKEKSKYKAELNLTHIKEPQNLGKALALSQSDKWIQAVKEKLSNLERLKI